MSSTVMKGNSSPHGLSDPGGEAPGPVVETADAVRTAVLRAHESMPEFVERRAAWRKKFTPLEDGRAGDRVVQRMLDAGWFD